MGAGRAVVVARPPPLPWDLEKRRAMTKMDLDADNYVDLMCMSRHFEVTLRRVAT